MQQKYYWIIGIIAILALIIIGGYIQQTKPNSQINACEELAKNLDEKIIDTNNPPGRFIISDFEGIVGGTITKISEPQYFLPSDEEQSKITYTITFKGINKAGDLFLRTSSETTLPYRIGAFYRFDLKNINQYSAQLSGAFMDPELNALEYLQECN